MGQLQRRLHAMRMAAMGANRERAMMAARLQALSARLKSALQENARLNAEQSTGKQ